MSRVEKQSALALLSRVGTLYPWVVTRTAVPLPERGAAVCEMLSSFVRVMPVFLSSGSGTDVDPERVLVSTVLGEGEQFNGGAGQKGVVLTQATSRLKARVVSFVGGGAVY